MNKKLSSPALVVYVTAKDQAEGRKIAQYLLQERLAACVNILPEVESHYWWSGQLDQSAEVLLIIKTQKNIFQRLTKAVKAMHSYQVPEIIALPVVAGEANYLKWLRQETR